MKSIAEKNDASRSRAVPMAMMLFALIVTFTGLLSGDGPHSPPPPALGTAQMELIRADANAGFPLPPEPDNPPRGPGL
jgi:hypothetical protein